MNKKKVLIVDDKEVRNDLSASLKLYDFETYVASTAAEARRLAKMHWQDLDVIIWDMNLDDPSEPLTTGADIGIECRTEMKSFPPEALIYSIKNQIDYYRLALRLGAAAYLLKDVDRLPTVVQHVRVLALRRALNGENPKIAADIARIAVHSRSKPDAILMLCRTVLKPEFEACLRVPFLILFTEDSSTQNCADTAGLPQGSSAFYNTLQALAHGKGNLTEPFILETDRLEAPPDQQTAALYERLNRAAFLPLSLSNNLKLSIGILDQERDTRGSGSSEAKALCTVLAQYLRPTVLENVLNIWSQWTELRATRTSTAKLCLSVGQEINAGLDTKDLPQLEDLANDLNDTGQYLAQLDRYFEEENDPILVRDLVAEAWKFIAQAEDTSNIRLQVQGDCAVKAQRSDLEIVFSRLLQWFMYRSKAMPLDVTPDIKINCEATNGGATITFEDNSHRLPKRLREDLFAPFTQAISTPFAEIDGANHSAKGPSSDKSARSHLNTGRYLPLYLTKMLVEGRYHGLLEDHSDEITERSYGHRILMQFPGNNAG